MEKQLACLGGDVALEEKRDRDSTTLAAIVQAAAVFVITLCHFYK
jgi:hypothetical protein